MIGAMATSPDVFRTRETVEAVVDLPGVAAGTRGRVLTTAGFSWIRYFVQFDTGIELSGIDGSQLRRVSKG